MLGKILNAGIALAITAVLLGSTVTTPSWGMIGDEIEPLAVPRSIRSVEDLANIWNPEPLPSLKNYYCVLDIQLPSVKVDRIHVSFSLLPQIYPFLTELSIQQMTLGGSARGHLRMQELADVLANNTTIKKLTLKGCNVDNVGATCLANVLQKNSTIKQLNLNFNSIDDDGLAVLGSALQVNKTLKSFRLADNKQITDKGIASFGQSLYDFPHPTLIFIDFSGYSCKNTQEKRDNLRDLLESKGYDVEYF